MERGTGLERSSVLDESYVSRLFSGERSNPCRGALIRLCVYGLELSVRDTEEIQLAADYKGLVLPQSLR